jgi:hypothetical protein
MHGLGCSADNKINPLIHVNPTNVKDDRQIRVEAIFLTQCLTLA